MHQFHGGRCFLLALQGGTFDYAYDRGKWRCVRGDFERCFSSIVSARARRVNRRHSMGTMLTLESLRQLHARYGGHRREGSARMCLPHRTSIWMFSSAINRIGPLAGKSPSSRDERSRVGVWANRCGMTRVRRRREGRHRAARVRVIDASEKAGHHQPRFVP